MYWECPMLYTAVDVSSVKANVSIRNVPSSKFQKLPSSNPTELISKIPIGTPYVALSTDSVERENGSPGILGITLRSPTIALSSDEYCPAKGFSRSSPSLNLFRSTTARNAGERSGHGNQGKSLPCS